MISSNDFKTGVTIEYEGNIYSVIEFQHVKPGKGAAFVRSKLRNLRTGAVISNTFRAGEKMKKAHIDKNQMVYLYAMGDTHVFMNNETYEQIEIQADSIAYQLNFITENLEVNVISHEGEILGVEIPEKVTLEVIEAAPGVKGNTVTNATKDAVVQTGFRVQVPLFVETGDKIVINTNTGKYDTRA